MGYRLETHERRVCAAVGLPKVRQVPCCKVGWAPASMYHGHTAGQTGFDNFNEE